MRNSHFLYGSDFDATQLRELTAEQYLYRKIHASQELVDTLSNEPLDTRDFFRINKSLEAQSHNRKLIDELYGKDIK